MNDWDNLAETSTDKPVGEVNNAAKSESKVVAHTAAKNNNKMMYLAMGGLMLLVMGVFGYTKYAEFLQIQESEQKARRAQLKGNTDSKEQEKAKPDAKAEAAQPKQTPIEPVAEQNKSPQAQATSDELNVLTQLKAKPASATTGTPRVEGSATQQPLAPPQQATNSVRPEPQAPMQVTMANAGDNQKREQYVRLLEGRVNDLGLSKLRLEAELCKYEPQRSFCSGINKAPVTTNGTPAAPTASSKRAANLISGESRVMLFDTAKRQTGTVQEITRTPVNAAQSMNQESGLPGLTILRDRVLYRDKDGMTQEVELGGAIAGLGRLERIDFERKSFQAGGRIYN